MIGSAKTGWDLWSDWDESLALIVARKIVQARKDELWPETHRIIHGTGEHEPMGILHAGPPPKWPGRKP